ncbi:hypothetical protein GCM10008090_24650 [Arenicella chitinivorans]|uniref:DUF4437 domain-containing protein n=1 Tax=Arenicella chitinivorans TaxID=1329800 RepID=A0A918RYR7_9GAMM|nr:DUF4437 domain-containing protein [Arenicella chitinivorans]GHA13943.1 hypothetical protein GCM10008090_24650 [Arenicella chitinivorans]
MNKLKLYVFALVISTTALASKAEDYKVIAKDNIEWGLLNPLRGDASPRAANLWGDRTQDIATGMLVKFKKGFSSPPHIHNISYRGVVIEGFLHNDDPAAEKMWLSTGSFWTQPAGETHITAANGQDNLIYLEIDSGPYLVLSDDKAFDNGERPINVDERNLIWLDTKDVKWLKKNQAQIAYLWGAPQSANGSFVKLPTGFKGTIENDQGLKAVVVRGKAFHQWNNEKKKTELSPSSFFRSEAKGKHKINVENAVVLYINSNGRYIVE